MRSFYQKKNYTYIYLFLYEQHHEFHELWFKLAFSACTHIYLDAFFSFSYKPGDIVRFTRKKEKENEWTAEAEEMDEILYSFVAKRCNTRRKLVVAM